MSETADNAAKLVRMANQIGAFFKSYPEETAVEGVREHIAKFWTSGMRAEIIQAANSEGGGLDPIVATAVRKLKDKQAA